MARKERFSQSFSEEEVRSLAQAIKESDYMVCDSLSAKVKRMLDVADGKLPRRNVRFNAQQSELVSK